MVSPRTARGLDAALNDVARKLAAGTFAWRPEHEDVHMNVEAAVIAAVGPEPRRHAAGRTQPERGGRHRRATLAARRDRRTPSGDGALRAELCAARRRGAGHDPAGAHLHAAGAAGAAGPPPAGVCRDARPRRGRLANAAVRADRSPAGSGAVAGSGLPIDRERVAAELASPTSPTTRSTRSPTVTTRSRRSRPWPSSSATSRAWPARWCCGRRRMSGSSASTMRTPAAAPCSRTSATRTAPSWCELGQPASRVTSSRSSQSSRQPLAYHRDLQETRRALLDAVESASLCLDVMSAPSLGPQVRPRPDAQRRPRAGPRTVIVLADRLVAAASRSAMRIAASAASWPRPTRPASIYPRSPSRAREPSGALTVRPAKSRTRSPMPMSMAGTAPGRVRSVGRGRLPGGARMSGTVRASVVGASGYAGGELLRLLPDIRGPGLRRSTRVTVTAGRWRPSCPHLARWACRSAAASPVTSTSPSSSARGIRPGGRRGGRSWA